MKRLLAAAALAAALPASALAVDLRAHYDVDATALKAAVAGTVLTFQVYGDAACSGPVLDTVATNVDSAGPIEVLKLLVPKGAAKPPKTARLSPVLADLPASFAYYLKVTGTGVTPVGDACQPQFATPPSAIAGSTPGGFVSLNGPYLSIATLATTFPSAGTALVQFETELNGYSTNQYVSCFLLQDMGLVASFEMDPGDADSPIPWYDQRQSHQVAVAVTAGAHAWDVQCSLPYGPPLDVYGSRLNVSWSEAGL